MNNSVERLIEGMVAALREEVLPHTDGDYARGQAYGVIFALENLKRRVAWSPAFLGEQIAALDALADALTGLPAEAPRPVRASEVSEAARNAGDASVAALIDWCAGQGEPLPDAIHVYLARQLRHELTTSAPPMFAAISLGHE